MDHNFQEAIDAILVDSAYARRSIFAKHNDKYVCKKGQTLIYNNLEPYTPSNEDIFAEDWQIFGKGVLGTGNKEDKR